MPRLRDLRVERHPAAIRAYRGARRLAERLGVQFVVKTFYSPIPPASELIDELWAKPSALAGIDLDLGAQLAFLEGDLAPFFAEFAPPSEPTGRREDFHVDNGSYERGDADVLHAMLRHAKPARIVELGSGHSTLVMAAAVRANAAEGSPCELRSFDPFARVAYDGLPGLTALERRRAQDVPPAVFDALGDGDLLFVDTTHVARAGGDANFVILDVLPRLRPGVIVHVHDIFLPWEYPRPWLEDLGLFWSEQYLLQAFLALNRDYEIVCALHALVRAHPDRLAKLLPTWRDGIGPAAFWMRRRTP